MSGGVVPFSLKDAPSLIERLLPVQKLSAEAYKEQMAVHGKTLTALGSYWKGRKPLILNKACILGCLLPATDDPARDLEVFEMLMAMDDKSFVVRWPRRPKPRELLAALSIPRIEDYFNVAPPGLLPTSAPVDWSTPAVAKARVAWRDDVPEDIRRSLEAEMLPKVPYRERVAEAKRPEEVIAAVHNHIWDTVNVHLGTSARSFPELVEQLGIMRYGHRPRVADTFCGSGQIPFEAARLGCDVYASDLNPVASMLTWGAFNIVGGSHASRQKLAQETQQLMQDVQSEIDQLGVESDGKGWRAKVFLYCVVARCPQTGWMVPLLPTLVVSKGHHVIAELAPDEAHKCYNVVIRTRVSDAELSAAELGTVRADGSGQEPFLVHTLEGTEHRTKISTLRGDYRRDDGSTANRLRLWEKDDIRPRSDDIFQEIPYCIQWVRPRALGRGEESEFRAVSPHDFQAESVVEAFVAGHLAEWQAKGWVPDARIEPGEKTDEPIRTRGWTHWHHLFNPRQLLLAGLVNRFSGASLKPALTQVINLSCRISRVDNSPKGAGATKGAFDNQALNPLFNYGCRGSRYSLSSIDGSYKTFPLPSVEAVVRSVPADDIRTENDIYITDPPYGDAVKYEEILEFFIAWIRKNPPPEFAEWTWDSRRALAIRGEGEDFRRGMVAAYKQMTQCMPDNGIQIIMFTHQSGSIWADMANIVWASGLQVTAAWYVVTETDSALREGSYVKGTVLLVCRKRRGNQKTTRDELAWELQDEVQAQVQALTGLNQRAKGLYRDENVFEDADIQMAGYAAALRALTRYGVIDGRDMTQEAIRPRTRDETTFVDELITFAVDTANQCLVPRGVAQAHWDKLSGPERFYLKMLELESRGAKTLDNYQNFAKAFKVRDFRPLLASQRANSARLKGATELGKSETSEGSELYQTVLRAVLYALMELQKSVDGTEALRHLELNVPDYFGDLTQRELVLGLSDYLARQLEGLRPEEASAARVLRELVKGQRLG